MSEKNNIIIKKNVNGKELEVFINKDEVIEWLDGKITLYEDIVANESKYINQYKVDKSNPNYNPNHDYMADYRYDYSLHKTYENPNKVFCTPQEALDEFKRFKNFILSAKDEPDAIWNGAVYKKDGTFAKNKKPVILEAINSYHSGYGWETLVLRLNPIASTCAELELNIIQRTKKDRRNVNVFI